MFKHKKVRDSNLLFKVLIFGEPCLSCEYFNLLLHPCLHVQDTWNKINIKEDPLKPSSLIWSSAERQNVLSSSIKKTDK